METKIKSELEGICAEIKKLHGELVCLGRKTVRTAWQIGALLNRAHALAEHGTWYGCLGELGISPQSAGRWRKLADQYASADELEAKHNTIHAALTAVQPLSADRKAGHQSTDEYPEWYTPPAYIEAARATMDGIDLDPASCEAANETVKAKQFFAKDDDALNQTWKGRVWLNPPYNQPICGQLIQELLDSPDVTQAVVLSQDATDAAWWRKLASRSAVYGFARKRIKFVSGNGGKGLSPISGSTVFGIGVDPQTFMDSFDSLCHSFNADGAKKLAARHSRKERDLEAKRDRQERAELPATYGFEIYECRCADLTKKVHADSVDLIVTDPPYSKQHLSCWSELAKFAVHALKPGGQLLALSGQAWLPEVIDRLRVDGLTYRWTFNMQYKSGSSYRSFDRQIQSDWKPVLIFEKPSESGRLGGHFPHDVVKATAPDAESKQRHPWGQDEGAFRDILGKFADPGMTVCDPFVGGGTTAVVARELGCSFVGCDIDADCVATTWGVVSVLSVAA